MNRDTYKLTPKGMAVLAMLQVGLVTTSDDPRIEGFWTIFEHNMINLGYVQEGGTEHD